MSGSAVQQKGQGDSLLCIPCNSISRYIPTNNNGRRHAWWLLPGKSWLHTSCVTQVLSFNTLCQHSPLSKLHCGLAVASLWPEAVSDECQTQPYSLPLLRAARMHKAVGGIFTKSRTPAVRMSYADMQSACQQAATMHQSGSDH